MSAWESDTVDQVHCYLRGAADLLPRLIASASGHHRLLLADAATHLNAAAAVLFLAGAPPGAHAPPAHLPAPPPPHAEFLTVAEAAKRYPIGHVRLGKLIRSGELPHIRLGRRILLRPEAIETWLNKQERTEGEPS